MCPPQSAPPDFRRQQCSQPSLRMPRRVEPTARRRSPSTVPMVMSSVRWRSLPGLAAAHLQAGDPDRARMLHGESLALQERLGSPTHSARALRFAAEDELTMGDPIRANELFDQALEIARSAELEGEVVMILHGLGDVCLVRTEAAAAAEFYVEALARASMRHPPPTASPGSPQSQPSSSASTLQGAPGARSSRISRSSANHSSSPTPRDGTRRRSPSSNQSPSQPPLPLAATSRSRTQCARRWRSSEANTPSAGLHEQTGDFAPGEATGAGPPLLPLPRTGRCSPSRREGLDAERRGDGEHARHLRAVRAAADLPAHQGGARGQEGEGVRLGRPPTLPQAVVRRIQRQRARGDSLRKIAGT